MDYTDLNRDFNYKERSCSDMVTITSAVDFTFK